MTCKDKAGKVMDPGHPPWGTGESQPLGNSIPADFEGTPGCSQAVGRCDPLCLEQEAEEDTPEASPG